MKSKIVAQLRQLEARLTKIAKTFIYKGILVEIGEGYSNPHNDRQHIVIHFPDQEAYMPKGTSVSTLKRQIDDFLKTYKPEKNNIPF